MPDDKAKVGCHRLKYYNLGVMGYKLVVGLYGIILHHPVKVGRLQLVYGFVRIDLIKCVNKLATLVTFEIPDGNTVGLSIVFDKVDDSVALEFIR